MKRCLALLLSLVMVFSLSSTVFAVEENPIQVKLCNYVNSEGDLVNEKYIDFDVEPQMINDRVMIPIRFVAEELGYKVGWIDNNIVGKVVTVFTVVEKKELDNGLLNKNTQLKSVFSLIEDIDSGKKVPNFSNNVLRFSIKQPENYQKINKNVNFNTILNCNYIGVEGSFAVQRKSGMTVDYCLDVYGRNEDFKVVELIETSYIFDVLPQVIDGRTLVPLRAVGEMLGLEVEWDGVNRIVTLSVK